MESDKGLKTFGIRVRLARKAAKLTQDELAEACGYPGGGAVISKIEAGGMWPPLQMIDNMAKAMKTSPSALAFDDKAPTMKDLDEQTIAALTLFLGLNVGGRKVAFEYLESLHKVPKYKGK